MSLAQYRETVKLKGQKSRLFSFKSEIFEAIDMGMSLSHIQGFLAQHNIKISKQALHRWILSQKTYQPKTNVAFTPLLQKSEQKEANISTIIKSPKVEPMEAAPIQFDNLSNDPKYARIWQVAQERLQMREEALQEKKSENHDS